MRPVICKFCGGINVHQSAFCWKKPKIIKAVKRQKRIKPISDKNKTLKKACELEWFEYNPPNHWGIWECYLQISPECPVILTINTLVLEHIVPKVKAYSRRYDHTNIGAACTFCNEVKGSKTLEQLSETYPHLKALL